MYPNLYITLVGHPGTGKSRTIGPARRLFSALKEFKLAPISMTAASLIDNLARAKRFIPRLPDTPLEYNSLFICADELGTFMSKYDNDVITALSSFYDTHAYEQDRRKFNGEVIKIPSPQINMLVGVQPSMLMQIMPEAAWGQGFTSRMIMVFSDQRTIGDDFADRAETNYTDLIHDLQIISSITGQFTVTEEYRDFVNNWRAMGEKPVPNHPRLQHYVARRKAQIYKLSMISALERSNALILTVDDFKRAYNWLCNAEQTMVSVFQEGAFGADGAMIDEIFHFVQVAGDKGVSEQRIVRFAEKRVPFHSILRIIDIMERSGRIKAIGVEKRTGVKWFKASGADTLDQVLGSHD